jgi:leucyl/phenylalanyl-tRNA--protein transferase
MSLQSRPPTALIPEVSRYNYLFPNPRDASPEGLVAWGGDLNPGRVLSAYLQGIFPWYNENDPVLWWSPDPRLVLYPKDIRISKSLRRSMKKFEVRIDTNFEAVMRKCRDVRVEKKEGTWILEEVIESYTQIHRQGLAKSFEVYFEGELVGGLYGIDLGKVFCGESMFQTKSDASKTALVHLAHYCLENGYELIDCQVPSEHPKRMGAVEMGRDKFLDLLEGSLDVS